MSSVDLGVLDVHPCGFCGFVERLKTWAVVVVLFADYEHSGAVGELLLPEQILRIHCHERGFVTAERCIDRLLPITEGGFDLTGQIQERRIHRGKFVAIWNAQVPP